MATANQTARQKFLEARKAGVDAVTARKEAYGDIAPAQAGGVVQAQPITPAIQPTPTTPVTQTTPVTPTPTTPTTPTPQVTGVDGQKFTQAPVDTTTGLSKPIQSEQDKNKQYGGFIQDNGVNSVQPIGKVGMTDQEIIAAGGKVENGVQMMPAKKIETPVDYTQAKGREQDIISNLESFKAQGMTPEQILKASDYANASPEKKAIIEPYLKQTQPTTDSMFNSIVAKVDVPDAQKVLPSYKIAQNRYLKANMYASMTPSQVTQEMNASRLIEGSRTWEDLKTLNPKLAQDAQNLRIVNGSKSNIFTYVNNPDGTPVKDENGEQVKENNLVKTFTQDYLDDYGDFLREIYRPETMEEINAKIYTPDVKMAQDKATEIELELNAIEKEINSIEADIDKEMTGSGATGSRARLEKAIRAEKLQNLYSSTLKNYETYANKANNLINQNTATYQQAYKENQALQNALATAGGAKFQSELALAQSQAEFEQKLAQQAQLASDPTTATNQIIDTFAEMGIMADRSRQEIIADVQNKVARGIPLGQALTELQTAFKSKPLYKSMVDAQMRSLAPEAEKPVTPKWGVIGKDAQGNDKYGFINESTGTVTPYISPTGEVTGDLRYLADQFPNQAWAKNNNPAGITWNSNFDKGTGTAKLLADAGIQFSKGTARPANEGGNYVTFATIEDGLRAQQIMMTQTYGNSTVGNMLASWVGTSEGPNYAKQVAGMAGITDLGAKVSSLTPEQLSALQMAKIQKESPGLAKLLTQGTGTTGTQVTPEAQSWVNAWNNGTMDIETILTKIGTSKEAMGLKNQVIKAIDEQGGVAWRKENDPTVKNVEKLYNTATDLLSNKEQLQNVSGGIQMSPWDSLTKKKQTYLSNIQNLLDTNTLQQLIDAKSQGATFGALSNEELKMLQASASSLAAAAERDEKGNIVGFRLTEKELEKKLKELQTQYLDKISRMTGAGIKSNQEEAPTAPSQPTQENTGAGTIQYGGYTLKPM